MTSYDLIYSDSNTSSNSNKASYKDIRSIDNSNEIKKIIKILVIQFLIKVKLFFQTKKINLRPNKKKNMYMKVLMMIL